MVFLCISFIVIFIQNIYFSKMSDGEVKCLVQPLNVFIYTAIPMFLVMFPIMIFLELMNWHRIFSNTFGLMLAPKIDLGENHTSSATYFYNDPNILLQEIEPSKLNTITTLNSTLNELLPNANIIITQDQHTKILEQYNIKTSVGFFVWLLLTGIITSLISANSILLQDCIIE